MKRTTNRKQRRIASDVLAVATYAPAVATARLAKLATGSPQAVAPAWARMGSEKAAAAAASTVGMMFAGASAMMRTMFAFSTAFTPWGGTATRRLSRIQNAAKDAAVDVVRAGVAPVRRRVVRNAKRRGR